MHWQERDAALIRLAVRHVCASRHFFQYFTGRTTAYRRLEALRNRGLLRLVATLVGDAGRPEHVYSNSWKPKYDQLRHELLLTDFLLCYPDAETLRGWAVDRRRRPDAEMMLDGFCYDVELDTGEQSLAQVARRQRRYAGSDDYLLYVTMSERRLDGLRRHAQETVKRLALFTTLEAALADPRGAIWIDCQGERTSI